MRLVSLNFGRIPKANFLRGGFSSFMEKTVQLISPLCVPMKVLNKFKDGFSGNKAVFSWNKDVFPWNRDSTFRSMYDV